MALNPNIKIQNDVDALILVDETGNYDSVSNPGGWGSPNAARNQLTDSDVVVTMPSGTVLDSIDLGTWMTTTSLLSYDLTADLEAQDESLADGLYKFVFTLVSTSTQTVTVYAFRDNAIRERLIQLAQVNLDQIDFQTAKNMYDKMVYAFEAGNYTLVQEIYDDLTNLLDGDAINFFGCGC